MTLEIRTPDDEVDRLDWYYPPFHEGWTYQGVTYGGHSNFSVDWNRRTKSGGFLDDLGDPVLAAADGRVSEIEQDTGTVYLTHWGGKRRTEYRHMRRVLVKVGDRVQRGDQIGEIGAEGIDTSTAPGGVASPHLHHVHWRRSGADGNGPWERCKQSFYGEPVAASVHNSDSQPAGANLPGPVMLQGPPPPATWQGAFREAIAQRDRFLGQRDAARDQLALTRGERDAAQVDARNATAAADELRTRLTAAEARIVALENATPADCTAIVAELESTRAALADEQDRAIMAENIVDAVRRAVAA